MTKVLVVFISVPGGAYNLRLIVGKEKSPKRSNSLLIYMGWQDGTDSTVVELGIFAGLTKLVLNANESCRKSSSLLINSRTIGQGWQGFTHDPTLRTNFWVTLISQLIAQITSFGKCISPHHVRYIGGYGRSNHRRSVRCIWFLYS